MDYISLILSYAPVLVTLASAIAAITPTPKDDQALRWVRKFIDTLALNVANAKPQAPPPPPQIDWNEK